MPLTKLNSLGCRLIADALNGKANVMETGRSDRSARDAMRYGQANKIRGLNEEELDLVKYLRLLSQKFKQAGGAEIVHTKVTQTPH